MAFTVPTSVRRQTIADALRRTAQRLPHKKAIVCGSTTWTYAQFNALVSRLAAGLISIHMASFKAPKRVVFTDGLPKKPSGKLLKRQLREVHSTKTT